MFSMSRVGNNLRQPRIDGMNYDKRFGCGRIASISVRRMFETAVKQDAKDPGVDR
jgi:hypothetical protein